MISQDIFVGVVATLTGLFVLTSALLQSQWLSRFWIARHVENASNGSVSRLVFFGLGALCTILGAMLLMGFFPSQQESTSPDDGNRISPPAPATK